jgi:hypothetical protein
MDCVFVHFDRVSKGPLPCLSPDILLQNNHRKRYGAGVSHDPRYTSLCFLQEITLFRPNNTETRSQLTASATTQFVGIELDGTSVNLSRKLRGFGDPFSLCPRLWSRK